MHNKACHRERMRGEGDELASLAFPTKLSEGRFGGSLQRPGGRKHRYLRAGHCACPAASGDRGQSPHLNFARNCTLVLKINQESPMGLADVLNGMRNGPHGQVGSGGASSSGGMSPITMGLLALLAYKAMRGSGILGSETTGTPPRGQDPSRSGSQGDSDWLSRLDTVVGSGGGGSVLSGGLGELLKKFQQAGQGQAAQSWVGKGPNQSVAPRDLEAAIGADTLNQLEERTRIPRDRILAELKEHLPRTVDAMTPDGRLPTEQEAGRWA
jgi:uncharacterized protein YidB (DUF937 family)